jgi:hypothetical protein
MCRIAKNIMAGVAEMSVCMVSLEEHHFPADGNSNIEILIESRLPATLELILDKNTQLLFDQDHTNSSVYIARSLDKGAVLSLLCCIRNMGWNISASNGFLQNDVVIRKFYWEKLIDLSKVVAVQPLKSKRNSRRSIIHFDTLPTTEVNSSRTASNLAEFSRAIDRATAGTPNVSAPEITTPSTQESSPSLEDFPRPPALKPRRSSIAEGKPSLVFKQLAERRKVSNHSSHPLDPKFSTTEPFVQPPPPPVAHRHQSRAASSPPPALTNAVPFSSSSSSLSSNLPTTATGTTQMPKKGNVGGLANMFANQLMFQPGGAQPPIRKKQGLIYLTSSALLAFSSHQTRSGSTDWRPTPVDTHNLQTDHGKETSSNC